MTGVLEFVSVLIPSAVVGVVFFLMFFCLRFRKPEIFQPRVEAPDKEVEDSANLEQSKLIPPNGDDVGGIRVEKKLSISTQGEEPTLDSLPRPRPLSAGVIGWFVDLIKVSESEVLKTAGLDVVVYLRTMKLCLQLCLISGLYCFVILIPVYATGEGPPERTPNEEEMEEMLDDFDGLDSISLSNLANGSGRLWATFFAVYITTGAACYLIYKNYSEIFEMARKFHAADRVANYSVMVSQIPGHLINMEALREYYGEYPGNVESISIAKDVKELEKHFEERKKIFGKLVASKKKIAKTGERPHHRTGGCCCDKTDSIEFYTDQLKRIGMRLKEMEAEPREYGPVAFVTFSKLESASQCVNDVPEYDQAWTKEASLSCAQRAPEPRDIRWQALCIPYDVQQRNTVFVHIFMALLLLFWTIPVGLLSSIMNLDALTAALPFLKPVLDLSPAIRGILQGLLPTLALKIFMAILPIIIYGVHTLRFPKSKSHLDLLCTRRYYLCLVFMVFLVTTISGTLFASIEQFVEGGTNIGDVVNQLATSLPKQATFFMGYIALAAFSAHPMEISRLVPLILYYIFGISWDPDDLPYMEYRIELPNHLLIFTIGIAYTAVAPFMLIWVICYFAIGYVVWKHQVLYVYFQKFETGGRYWPDIVNRIVTAIVIFQVTTFGCVSLRRGAVQGPLILPSILILFYVQYRAHQKFRSVFYSSSSRYVKVTDVERDGVDFPRNAYEPEIFAKLSCIKNISKGTVEIEEKQNIV